MLSSTALYETQNGICFPGGQTILPQISWILFDISCSSVNKLRLQKHKQPHFNFSAKNLHFDPKFSPITTSLCLNPGSEPQIKPFFLPPCYTIKQAIGPCSTSSAIFRYSYEYSTHDRRDMRRLSLLACWRSSTGCQWWWKRQIGSKVLDNPNQFLYDLHEI